MNKLTLRTQDQVALFSNEIVGQISDGQWENSRPHNHWAAWSQANVVVGEPVGRNFIASRKYNLLNAELLSIVGNRMIYYVKLARAFGLENVNILSYLFDDDGNFTGLPTYEGEYYDKIRAKIAKFDLEQVKAVVAADTYTHKNLIADLKEIKKAMETYAN